MVEKRSNSKHKKRSGRTLFAALITVFVVAGAVALYFIITTQRGYSAAQDEYAGLRQYSPFVSDLAYTGDGSNEESDELTTPVREPVSRPDLSEINPDYVGWIWVETTTVDYPVVQTTNNTKYLDTTFSGERNRSGAIFMDSRSVDGFDGLAILYGHNMRDGSMFAGLDRFIGLDLRDNNYEIIIYVPEDYMLVYRIFGAKNTSAYDEVFQLLDMPQESDEDRLAFQAAIEAYFTGFDIPSDADILVLSTCTEGNRNNRTVVFGIR